MSAIEQCRSAALGGHVLRCTACQQPQIAYNSCLVGSLPLRGVRPPKHRPDWAARVDSSPLRLGLQQRNEPVRWPELALAKVGRHDCLNGLQLLAGVGANIDFRRGQAAVSQP
jgi:Transposase zinc-binding domain